MKKFCNRSLALLLALILCLSALSGIALPASAATVEYRYGNTTQYSQRTNIIYNWGNRGTTATFLSPNAEKFYAKNNTSLTALSALSGSSDISSVPNSKLFTTLRTLMTTNHDYITTYNHTRDMYAFTDCQNSAQTSNKISSFYSGADIGPAWDGGTTWNREHTWPNSKGDANGSGENDIMMLRPASVSENGSRSNKAYGEGNSYYYPNTESNDTYDVRGDVARIVLYTYVRWQDTSSSEAVLFGTSGVIESKAVLLKWLEEDPVDTWEMGRNDSVESITGTRNVFVDYPELGFILFGAKVPDDYESPSASQTSSCPHTNTTTTTVAATCTTNGSTTVFCTDCQQTVSTTTINAKGHNYNSIVTAPTETSQGYTTYTCLTCGDQYVGNYIPALGKDYTIQFSVPKGIDPINALTSNSTGITLPTANAPEGYTFAGWTSHPVEETDTAPDILTGKYVPTENITLYALYSRSDSAGTNTSWVLVTDTSALKVGVQLVIASNAKGFVAGNISSSVMTNVVASFSSDLSTMTQLPADAMVLTLGGSEEKWTLTNSEGKLLGATAVKKLAWGSGTTTWSISISNNNATIQNGSSSCGRFLYNVNSPRFTTYTSNTNAAMLLPQLYMLRSVGTTYYTTMTTLEPVAVVGDVEYTSFEAAYAASNGQTVQLLADIKLAALALKKNVVVDLNGNDFFADGITGAYTITVKDNATDDYAKLGGTATFTGDDTFTVQAADGYAMYKSNNGYTFNAYKLAITHISLDATKDALGYKATLKGNANVQAAVTSYGFTMGVVRQETVSKNGKIDDGVFSLRLTKIMATKGGEKEIVANAFVIFGSQKQESQTCKTSMQKTILAVNDIFSTLSETQQAAVQALYGKYETVMAKWLEGKTNHILPA